MDDIVAITTIEARNIIIESGIMLLLGCTLTSANAIDTIRRDPQAYVSEENFNNRVFGFVYSPKLHILAIWSMVPNTGNHEVIMPIQEVTGSMVVKRTIDITPIQETKLTIHVVMLSVDTTQISQKKYDSLLKYYNKSLDEINHMRTIVQASQSIKVLSSPSSSSLDFSTQEIETLALRIQYLNNQLKIKKENVKKAKMETVHVANDIFEYVLKYSVMKLVKKANNVWATQKNIHEGNVNYLQVQEDFQTKWRKWSTSGGTLK